MCGARYAPWRRKTPHEGSSTCAARVVQRAYEARGWVQLENRALGELAERACVPIEWALGGLHDETRAIDGRGGLESVTVQHNVPFVPRGVFRVWRLLARQRFDSAFRARAIKALWDREDLLDALESAKALSRVLSTRLVHESVVMAEEERDGQRVADTA